MTKRRRLTAQQQRELASLDEQVKALRTHFAETYRSLNQRRLSIIGKLHAKPQQQRERETA